jgi:hypothetical protein
MDHPEGAGSKRGDRLEFRGAQISSDRGLLVMRGRLVADQAEADQDRVVRHARAITFQLAEVAVTGAIVRGTFAAIRCLRVPPRCARR